MNVKEGLALIENGKRIPTLADKALPFVYFACGVVIFLSIFVWGKP